MFVIRMREYKSKPGNPNVPDHKIEVTTEHHAANFAHYESSEGWIYFFAELKTPEDL